MLYSKVNVLKKNVMKNQCSLNNPMEPRAFRYHKQSLKKRINPQEDDDNNS